MKRLPIELYHLIFDQLPLIDLAACAEVSKRFYALVQQYRVRELSFDRRTNFKWFHAKPIIYQHRVDYSMASLLRGSSFSLEYLKRLKIGRQSSIDNLNEINKFAFLEELDIDLKNCANQKKHTLRLVNLRVLYVFVPSNVTLKLNTPKLETLGTVDLKKLYFVYPKTLRRLETFFHAGKLLMFQNLQYLVFTDFYSLLDYCVTRHSKNFQECDLTKLRNLKEVRFCRAIFGNEWTNLETIKKIIGELLQRAALQRSGLRIFFQSVRVSNVKLLNEYRDTMRNIGSWVGFNLQHYEQLEERIEYFWSYSISVSVRKLKRAGLHSGNESFVSKFLAKYELRRLTVWGPSDPELLLKFIGSSKLMCLEFFWPEGLDQSFFDQMAESIRLNRIPVQRLRLKLRKTTTLNFKFVNKLLDLETFETDKELTGETIAELLTELPLLVEIVYFSSYRERKIERLIRKFRLDEKILSKEELFDQLVPDSICESMKLLKL